jgi:hydrogenase expression/formation protein HypC
MCLGIPGQVQNIDESELRMARVSFGGAVKTVSLSFLPEARIGDWVIVHAGFAISSIDESEARRVFELLEQMEPGEGT